MSWLKKALRCRMSGRQRLRAITMFAGLLFQQGMGIQAGEVGWIGDSGNWSDAANWSLGALPVADDAVYLTRDDAINRIVTLDVSLPPIDTLRGFLGSVSIDGMGGSLMSFVQGVEEFSAGFEYVGVVGTGTFAHTAGRNSAKTAPGGIIYDITDIVQGAVYIGVQSTSTGTYLLSGTGELVSNATFVGYRGTGTFSQSGGSHSAAEGLSLGYVAGSHGTYTLSDGHLGSTGILVGRDGTGTFVQSGGTHTTSGNLGVSGTGSTYTLSAGVLTTNNTFVGNGSFTQTGGEHTAALIVGTGTTGAGPSAYHMNGGSLSANTVSVGLFGSGTFDHTAGTVDVNNVGVGDGVDGPGTYDLSGSGVLSAFLEYVGAAANGTFVQHGGTNTAAHHLNIGVGYGMTGTYNLTAGTLNVMHGTYSSGDPAMGMMTVGLSGTGVVNQSGGTVTIDGPRSIDGILSLGLGPGTGSYNLGGTGTLFANEENIGHNSGSYGGIASFNQTGGTHTVRRNLYIGAYVTASGIYTLSDGALAVGAEGFAGRTYVGSAGGGVFTQTGGAHTASSRVVIASLSNAVGTYNLSAGTLTTPNIDVGSGGIGSLIQSGGTLTVASTVYIAGYFVRDPVTFVPKRSGYYELSGGRLNAGQVFVGNAGIGEFNQTGGENVISGTLHVSSAQNSSGTYTLSNGSLSSFRTHIGMVGTGLFDHSGGSHTVADLLRLGSTPGTGTYLLSDTGTLTAAGAYVGSTGTGLFEQSGGTATLSGNLYVGHGHGISGQYHLSDGTLTAANTFLGSPTAAWTGAGLFSQTGGTHTLSGTLTIAGTTQGAANPAADGTYDLTNGTLNASGIVNYDHLNFFGGSLTSPITNHGSFTLSGDGTRTVNGHVVNYGTINVVNTTVSFPLGLENYGIYDSDPSENRFCDLVVYSTGCLTAGDGDQFIVSGNLTSASANPAWDTVGASLRFNGTDEQTLDFSAHSGPFTFDSVTVASGTTLAIRGGADGTLVTRMLDLQGPAALVSGHIVADAINISASSSLDLADGQMVLDYSGPSPTPPVSNSSNPAQSTVPRSFLQGPASSPSPTTACSTSTTGTARQFPTESASVNCSLRTPMTAT